MRIFSETNLFSFVHFIYGILQLLSSHDDDEKSTVFKVSCLYSTSSLLIFCFVLRNELNLLEFNMMLD
jgi:hypothetical protein